MNYKMTYPLIYILVGAVIGAAAMWIIVNCCCKSTCERPGEPGGDSPGTDTTGMVQLDAITANKYFRAYMKNPQVDTFMAFTINAQQFYAMKKIAAANVNVRGFRIYMGMDSLTPLRMVVGTGSPEYAESIIRTTDVASGPCPHVCDDNSPIFER